MTFKTCDMLYVTDFFWAIKPHKVIDKHELLIHIFQFHSNFDEIVDITFLRVKDGQIYIAQFAQDTLKNYLISL